MAGVALMGSGEDAMGILVVVVPAIERCRVHLNVSPPLGWCKGAFSIGRTNVHPDLLLGMGG